MSGKDYIKEELEDAIRELEEKLYWYKILLSGLNQTEKVID